MQLNSQDVVSNLGMAQMSGREGLGCHALQSGQLSTSGFSARLRGAQVLCEHLAANEPNTLRLERGYPTYVVVKWKQGRIAAAERA